MEFEKSYIAHENHWFEYLNEKEERFFLFKNKNCVEYILKTQSLNYLRPFLNEKNSWLTVGDYNGFEASFFSENNQNVIASDISDCFLIEAQKMGFIDKFKKINVEKMDFDDKSIDYVSCRESLHHFPRAYLGLYEMLRVAKKGVIIIEPIDILSKMPLLLLFKNFLDIFNPHLINRLWKNRFSWEPVGNYVFKISEREIEKIAMGMGLPCIAFKNFNLIHSIKENTKIVPIQKKLLRKINRKYFALDLLAKFHFIPFNSTCAIIFKEIPETKLIDELKKMGYRVIHLPENPYIKN